MTHPAPDVRSPPPADTPAEEVIARELAPGERLIWAGQPPQGICILAIDLLPVLISVIFLVAGVGGLIRGAVLPGWGPNPVGAAIVVAFALLTLGDRFVLAPRRRRQTWYGLTSERVVVVTRRRGTIRRCSLMLAQAGEIHVRERSDGGGLIGFGRAPWSLYSAGNERGQGRTYGFIILELRPVHMVFDLIRDVQRANLLLTRSPDA